jgi:hypothetical protein
LVVICLLISHHPPLVVSTQRWSPP